MNAAQTPSPANDIEALLIQMSEGALDPQEFAARLLDQQVFMPVKDEKHQIAGFQRSTKAEPLVVQDDEGNRVVVVFTSPERAKGFVTEHPGYAGGLIVEVSWLLRRIGAGMSLSINPGEEPGFDFDPDMVSMLVAILPEERQ